MCESAFTLTMDATSLAPSSHLCMQHTAGLWHRSLIAIFYVFQEGLDVIILRTSYKYGNLSFRGGKVSLDRCLVFKTRMVRSHRLEAFAAGSPGGKSR